MADASVGDAGTNTQDAGPDAPEIGGDVPEDILGVWVGNAVPAVGGYPITVVLAPGATGSVVGISAYPTFPCGGALTLVDGSNVGLTDGGPPDSGSFAVDGSVNLLPSGVVTKETLTWGISNCGNDGNEVFSLRTDGALNWTWESSGYVETGVLSRVGAFGFDVPTSYLGVWLGTVVSDAGDAGDAGPASEGVTAAITVGTSGDVIGAIAYHDTACVGQWTMTASTPDLVVTEAITQGSCADGGTVTLSVSGSSLAYAWRRAGEPTRTGTLSPPVF